MKKVFLGLIIMLTVLIGNAQNDKNVVFDANAEIRKVTGFTSIEVSGAVNLYLSQGIEEGVAVSAGEESLVSKIRTSVRDNVLYIDFDSKGLNWKNWSNNKIKAYVTFITLKKIEASGACNIKTAGLLKLSDIKIELSGASDFSGEIEATNLAISLSGASDLKLKGTAEKLSINSNGASSIKAYDLKSEYCKIDASGASSVQITVNKEMNAKASGASSINYKGDAVVKDFTSSGASSVRHRTNE